MVGIYKITNPKGRVYIGQSVNVERRFSEYRKLKCKKQPRIYASLLKYGYEKHKFEIISLCDKKDLDAQERYYQELYETLGVNGMNCVLTAYWNIRGERLPHTDETKLKLRNANLGKKHSNATIEKCRIASTGSVQSIEKIEKLRNANLGKKLSEETKIKIGNSKRNPSIETRMKLSLAGKNKSEDGINRLRDANIGKKHSEATKQKMSNWHKGKKFSKESVEKSVSKRKKIILNIQTGIFYFGITDAALSVGSTYSVIAQKLTGKIKNNTNLIYV